MAKQFHKIKTIAILKQMNMNRFIYIGAVAFMLLGSVSCSNSNKQQSVGADSVSSAGVKEDILVGSLNVVVDASVLPLLKEQEDVFLSAYPNAKLNFIAQPEVLAVKDLLEDKASVAILARELSEEENKNFASRSIQPRIFPVFSDAIVFVGHTNSSDTSVTIQEVLDLMKGTKVRGNDSYLII